MWNVKYGSNDPIYNTEKDHGHGDQTCVCQGEGGRGGNGQGVCNYSKSTIITN